MRARLPLEILPQPDDTTCGPTCLQAVYRYHGDPVDLRQLITEVPVLETGGTLAVHLACHALRRNYLARIYTFNLQVFDPTWFRDPRTDLADRLRRQQEAKPDPKLRHATEAYLEFLARGGEVVLQDLNAALIRRYLDRRIPILTGLSSTYLYGTAREFGPNNDYDDIRGEPAGHFVVLYGYERRGRRVLVADPYHTNPMTRTQQYVVGIDRVVGAILLGVLTFDANLLILEPPAPPPVRRPGDTP